MQRRYHLHRDAGFTFDRKQPAIARVLKGICNSKARRETVRKAKLLLANDLRALIDGRDQQSVSGARDAALLALRWAAALRRSELVSLEAAAHAMENVSPTRGTIPRAAGAADGRHTAPLRYRGVNPQT
jgi:integrase